MKTMHLVANLIDHFPYPTEYTRLSVPWGVVVGKNTPVRETNLIMSNTYAHHNLYIRTRKAPCIKAVAIVAYGTPPSLDERCPSVSVPVDAIDDNGGPRFGNIISSSGVLYVEGWTNRKWRK